MIALRHLLLQAFDVSAGSTATQPQVLQLLERYETEFDAMCTWVAGGHPFVAARDRFWPLYAAYSRLLPREPGPMAELLDAHRAVVTQLFLLAEAIDGGGDAGPPAAELDRLHALHSAAVRRARERVQRP